MYIVEKQLYGENVSVYEDAGQRLITKWKISSFSQELSLHDIVGIIYTTILK